MRKKSVSMVTNKYKKPIDRNALMVANRGVDGCMWKVLNQQFSEIFHELNGAITLLLPHVMAWKISRPVYGIELKKRNAAKAELEMSNKRLFHLIPSAGRDSPASMLVDHSGGNHPSDRLHA